MPKVSLTDITLKSLTGPKSGQVTYWDESVSGFGVRVSQGGTKSFVVVYGVNRQRETLGRYPIISLKQARDKAKKRLAEVTLGIQQDRSIPYQDAKASFLKVCEGKNKKNTVDYYRKRLNAHFRFGRKRLNEITRRDVQSRIGKIKISVSEQYHAFVVIRTFLNWAVREQYLDQSPIVGLTAPSRPKAREHFLRDQELAMVYAAALAHSFPFGPIVSLLILTGQRRSEIASLQWDWIDRENRTITLPGSLTKNKHSHSFPFGELVLSVLQTIPNTGPFLFPSRSVKASVFNGWGKSKERFDRDLENVGHYTLHDLRRTFATNHAKIGTPIHVTEKLLNHISGTISGVSAVYNRHSYIDEMRAAVMNHDTFLKGLIDL